MKDKVIEILMMTKSDESIMKLSDLCGVRNFQASNIIDQYQSLQSKQVEMINRGMDASNYGREMQEIIRGLISGEYSKTQSIQNDLKNEVIKLLQGSNSENDINALSNLSGIDRESTKLLMEQYKEISKREFDQMSQRLDASNLTNQKLDIINQLSSLENLNNRKI